MGLISKLINKIIGEVEEEYDIPQFYIPEQSTLRAIKNNEKLEDFQIIDYLNYIKDNYYLSSSDEIYLASFAAQWIAISQDDILMEEYMDKSTNRIINNLSNGDMPSIIDMLWVSERIFVNNTVEGNKRIITKVNLPTPRFEVKTGYQDFKVVEQVNELKFQLMSKLISKNLDNTK
ncbi:MAG: hypothetical protein ACLRFE_02455 [Clostridia bacterium]